MYVEKQILLSAKLAGKAELTNEELTFINGGQDQNNSSTVTTTNSATTNNATVNDATAVASGKSVAAAVNVNCPIIIIENDGECWAAVGCCIPVIPL
jgi:hypothetical protein